MPMLSSTMILPRRWMPVLILLVLVWPAVLQAQTSAPVGQLELLKGVVKVRHLAQERVYRKTAVPIPVYEGDLVQTGRETKAKIEFLGGKDETMELFSGTQITIEKMNRESSFLGLNIGKIFLGIFAAARRKSFEVNTASATIGIKGTEFVVGSTGQDTFLLTTEGTVSIINKQFPNIEVLVTQDQVSKTSPNQPPTLPVTVTPEVRETIVQEDGLQTFETMELPPAAEQSTQEEESSEEEEEEPEEEEQAAEEEEQAAEEEEQAAEEEQPAEEEQVVEEEQSSEEEQVAGEESGTEGSDGEETSVGGEESVVVEESPPPVEDSISLEVIAALDLLEDVQETIQAASETTTVVYPAFQIKIVR